jgi:hypothetical protein
MVCGTLFQMTKPLPKAVLAARDRERFLSKTIPEPNSGCLLWTAGVDDWGYGQFSVGGRKLRAHRVAWVKVHGEIPKGMLVLHRCDTPPCVNVDHLFLGTNDDNMRDMVEKGRAACGEALVQSKLTEDDVRAIRKDPRDTVVLGREYGVDHTSIGRIKRRVTWKHVE